MQLFDELAVSLSDDAGVARHVAAREWVEEYVGSRGAAGVVGVCESTQPAAPPAPLSMQGQAGVDEVMSWMTHLSVALDAYTWMFRRGYAAPIDVLTNRAPAPARKTKASRKRGRGARAAADDDCDQPSAASSTLLLRVKYFLASLAFDTALVSPVAVSGGAGGAAAAPAWSLHDAPLTPAEVDRLRRMRAILCCRICVFVATVLSPKAQPGVADIRTELAAMLHSSGCTTRNLHRFALLCVLDPRAVAVDTVDSMAGSQVPLAARRLFSCVSRIASVDRAVFDDCASTAAELLRMREFDVGAVDLTAADRSVASVGAVVRVLSLLHSTGLLGAALGTRASSLPRELGARVAAVPPGATPLQVQLCSSVLRLALDIGWDDMHTGHGSALAAVLDARPVTEVMPAAAAPSQQQPFGLLFYERFRDVLDGFFLRKSVWPDVCAALVEAVRRTHGAGQNLPWFVLRSIMEHMVSAQAAPDAAPSLPLPLPPAAGAAGPRRIGLFDFVDSVSAAIPSFDMWVAPDATENDTHNFLALLGNLAAL